MSEPQLSADVRAFLESMLVPGVLTTLRENGSPKASSVWFGFLEGDVIISTPAAGRKAKNARADGRVSFLVDTRERPYRGVAIDGVAEVIEDKDAALVLSIARRYLGDAAGEWAAARGVGPERVIIRIRPQRVRPWNIAPAPTVSRSSDE